jgi:hypothetical protein
MNVGPDILITVNMNITGYDTMQSHAQILTLWRNMLHPSQKGRPVEEIKGADRGIGINETGRRETLAPQRSHHFPLTCLLTASLSPSSANIYIYIYIYIYPSFSHISYTSLTKPLSHSIIFGISYVYKKTPWSESASEL